MRQVCGMFHKKAVKAGSTVLAVGLTMALCVPFAFAGEGNEVASSDPSVATDDQVVPRPEGSSASEEGAANEQAPVVSDSAPPDSAKPEADSTEEAIVEDITPQSVSADGAVNVVALGTIYVSSAGNDATATGESAHPYASLAKAVDMATSGDVIAVMDNLVITQYARIDNKTLTIESATATPVAITRGDGFGIARDNARRWYNPAMIEVVENAHLTLSNIILDDAGKYEGTLFLSPDTSGDIVGDANMMNTHRVQDAMIAVYPINSSSVTLDNAQLKNFGGMSAIRATGVSSAQLSMVNGSLITADSDSYVAQNGRRAGVWLQGDRGLNLRMESGTKITNLPSIAIAADGGTVSLSGELSGNKETPLASNGGNVTIEADGIITNNSGGSAGGGAYANMGSMLVIKGKITNNTSLGRGAGVYVQGNGPGSTATLEAGGEISGNTSILPGAGVNVDQSSNFIMNGGIVTNNEALSGSGSGVYLKRGARFTMNGGSVVNNGGTVPASGKDITMQSGIRDWGRMGYVSLNSNAATTVGPDQVYVEDEAKSIYYAGSNARLTVGDMSAADKATVNAAVTAAGLTYLESTWVKPEGETTDLEITKPATANAVDPFYAAVVETDDLGVPAGIYSFHAVNVSSTGNLAVSVPTSLTAAGHAIVIAQGAGPVITKHPEDTSVLYGETATFEVAVEAATGMLGYQWQKTTDGGVTWVNISGANAATYTTPATSDTDNGNLYRCEVTSSVVSIALYSNTAALTVSLPLAISPSSTFEQGKAFDTTVTVGSALSVTASLNLDKVMLDGIVLTEGVEYTSEDGSIIINLPSSYLNTLTVGTHALGVTTKSAPYDGLSASTDITVTPAIIGPGDDDASVPDEDNPPVPDKDGTVGKPVPGKDKPAYKTFAATGDTNAALPWAIVAALSGLCVCIAALLRRRAKRFFE